MLTAIPRSSSRHVNATLVNCETWSLLKISGCPPCSAHSSASRQNVAFRLLDNSQLNTQRLGQSITAT